MVTPIPPLTAKTLDDIKTKLANFTSQEYNETRYINTWDGGGNSKRESFENASTLQKETTLGSETVQLRYFWSFSSFYSIDANNPNPIYGNAIQSTKTWPLNVKEGIGECRRCPHELVASNTSTLCQECPSGKIASEAAAYCTSCPHNHTMVMDPLSRNNTKDKCVCMSGYEKKSFLKCKACSVGFYSSFINSTCIASPPGGFIPNVGMTEYFRCRGNFVSTTRGASFCVPCPSNTFSNHQNTICLPDKSLYEKIPSIYEYKINLFCIDLDNHGILDDSSVIILTKINTSNWDNTPDIKAKFDNFRYENQSFVSNIMIQKCTNSFVYSMPIECPFHMFSMRNHSYIWDCVSCTSGKFKTTRGTSYSECIQCINEECHRNLDECRNDKKIIFRTTNLNFSDFHRKT